MLAGGGMPRSQTTALRLRRAPASVRAELGLSSAVDALFLARERYVDDELAAYAQTWLAADLVPKLSAVVGASGSLYGAFEQSYRLAPMRAAARAEFVISSERIARKLRINGPRCSFDWMDEPTPSGCAGQSK